MKACRPDIEGAATIRTRNDGFILVETIVTMAISAFLLVALTMLISFVAQSFDRTTAAGDDLETESRTLAAIARDLHLVQRVTFAGEGTRFAFRGTSSRILFAQRFDAADGMDVVRLVDLNGNDVDGGGGVTRREAALPPDAEDFDSAAFGAANPYPRGLRIRFGYFAQVAPGVEALTDDWLIEGQMPVAIQVTLLAGNGRPAAPALRVPLMIDAEPGCASPNESNCSYAKPDPEATAASQTGDGTNAGRIDPDDSLGWARYAR